MEQFSSEQIQEKQDFLTKEIEAVFSGWQQEGQRIQDVIANEVKKHQTVKDELMALEAGLPGVLAKFCLGEADKSEVTKARKKRDELKGMIEIYPFLQAGLNHRSTAHESQGRRLARIKDMIEKCAKIIDELGNTVDRDYLATMKNDLQGLWLEIGKRLDEVRGQVNS
jgi:septation ring formation regulator EzrA